MAVKKLDIWRLPPILVSHNALFNGLFLSTYHPVYLCVCVWGGGGGGGGAYPFVALVFPVWFACVYYGEIRLQCSCHIEKEE